MHPQVKGTPPQGLAGATLGFFIGFAAVALFGTSAAKFKDLMALSPIEVAVLVAVPSLTGSLLRIPFSAWVDSTGGRKPFLVLLSLSVAGMLGLTIVATTLYPDHLDHRWYGMLLLLGALAGCGIATFSVGASQVAYWYGQQRQGKALAVFAGVGNLAPGLFSLLLPFALAALGLGGSYILWLSLLILGTVLYAFYGRNAWYFQFLRAGMRPPEAREAARGQGQELFPSGTLKKSLSISSQVWRTWALVWIYFTTFGGFIALTAWLPTYWMQYFSTSAVTAGMLTAAYSVLTSAVRILGGVLSDKLREGGENTAILALFLVLVGALIMTISREFELAVPGVMLLALGMGICNAAVFKLVPQAVPEAVGGATGLVGGLGALGGFIIPLVLGFAVTNLGKAGYAIGFVVFILLASFSLAVAWVLKYTREPAGGSAGEERTLPGAVALPAAAPPPPPILRPR